MGSDRSGHKKPLKTLAQPLRLGYDKRTDVLTIEGVRYHGDLFRGLGIGPTPVGRWLRIVKVEADGVVTIEERLEDQIVRAWCEQRLPKG